MCVGKYLEKNVELDYGNISDYINIFYVYKYTYIFIEYLYLYLYIDRIFINIEAFLKCKKFNFFGCKILF